MGPCAVEVGLRVSHEVQRRLGLNLRAGMQARPRKQWVVMCCAGWVFVCCCLQVHALWRFAGQLSGRRMNPNELAACMREYQPWLDAVYGCCVSSAGSAMRGLLTNQHAVCGVSWFSVGDSCLAHGLFDRCTRPPWRMSFSTMLCGCCFCSQPVQVCCPTFQAVPSAQQMPHSCRPHAAATSCWCQLLAHCSCRRHAWCTWAALAAA